MKTPDYIPLPASLQGTPRVLHGKRFDVHRVESAGPDGKNFTREYVVHPGAVVILGLLDNDHIVMIRNHRVAVDAIMLELPAGTLEPPEATQICAARELTEETGYTARRITLLTKFFTSPGICTEQMFAYLAEGLTAGKQELDEGEEIITEAVQYDKALEMIRDGTIRDGKSIATILFYDRFFRHGKKR